MVRRHRNESHFQRSGFETDDFPGASPQAEMKSAVGAN
jgi:hypothetical protein